MQDMWKWPQWLNQLYKLMLCNYLKNEGIKEVLPPPAPQIGGPKKWGLGGFRRVKVNPSFPFIKLKNSIQTMRGLAMTLRNASFPSLSLNNPQSKYSIMFKQ